ncbi:MAG: terminase [Muribaculaceae bacterium]|nr:terminase [Muribaculaceae bacterium]
MNTSSYLDKPEPQITEDIDAIVAENRLRLEAEAVTFDPLTGIGAPGERFDWLLRQELSDSPVDCRLPVTMLHDTEWSCLFAYSDVAAYNASAQGQKRPCSADDFNRLRLRHDFAYWAGSVAMIKPKGGGADIPFRLNRPQRLLVERLEAMRTTNRPIRLLLLKARQWGGSTCIQLYMAWLQLTQAVGLNSLIIAHQSAATDEIRDMFDRMIEAYPGELLESGQEKSVCKGSTKRTARTPRRLTAVGRSRSAVRLEARDCKIKVGTAERPDSCRGGDYNLVHLSEVGMWKKTLGKKPEDIVRSACSGVLFRPLTMIVLESTANGTGNFFHREYLAAASGDSQFKALFVSWYQIEQYALPLTETEERALAGKLLELRSQDYAPDSRRQPGRYLWWLWQRGATLQSISWYIAERSKYSDHAQMAAEYPTDDVEAFVHSGARVFDRYKVEAMRSACRLPSAIGEVEGAAPWGAKALEGVHFTATPAGTLHVWAMPEYDGVRHRYLAVVDIGGRSAKADWSVVAVFDRLPLTEGHGPEIVAQWRGHCDIDLLAWKAAQIALWYDEALLVIESNTLETRDSERWVEGDQAGFILNQIRSCYANLYARSGSPEDIREGTPVRYGFHTNSNTKPMIISGLICAIRERLYVERCEACLEEYLTYERRPNGSYGALPSTHDDMLMTRAIGLHISRHEMPLPELPVAHVRRRDDVHGHVTAAFFG